jgi:CheY-like chemotaxis protein
MGNVLHNATKYTDAGGEISVHAERNGKSAIVRVRDTGCGIPPDMLANIFEMFRQVDQSLGRAHGGLGIGLTLVKRLVDLHGGMIEAQSEGAGRGSEFIITLPLAAREPDGLKADELPFSGPNPVELPRRRILVVDDNQSSAETLAMMLQTIGQDVSTAHDGATAVEQALSQRPDVVFLDIAMPGMDGYEAARRIRAARGLESTLLVALTGYGQEEDRRRSGQAGFNHHLTKPTSMEALLALLKPHRDRDRATSVT